ncbi:MAG: OsmC family protein [Kofleriaceae bacterium]
MRRSSRCPCALKRVMKREICSPRATIRARPRPGARHDPLVIHLPSGLEDRSAGSGTVRRALVPRNDLSVVDRFVLVHPGMPAPFPHVYSANVSRTFASRARVEAPPRAVLHGGPSCQLDGDNATWSPEYLMLSSLGMCMLTTFEAFASRDGIDVIRWDANVSGTVERTPEGLMFTSIVLGIDMEVSGNVSKIEGTLEAAKQYCLVLNSLRVPVVVETQIHTPDDDVAQLPFGVSSYVGLEAQAG